MDFVNGDTVIMKSGGPTMIVIDENTKYGYVTCAWFDRNGEVHQNNFLPITLEKYRRPRPGPR
jgi:uncharacterized protein YodC (DUF2158 family)